MHVKASRSIRSSIQYTVFCFSTCTDKDFLNFHSFFFLSKVHVVYFEKTDTQLLSIPANNGEIMTFGSFFSTSTVEREGWKKKEENSWLLMKCFVFVATEFSLNRCTLDLIFLQEYLLSLTSRRPEKCAPWRQLWKWILALMIRGLATCALP